MVDLAKIGEWAFFVGVILAVVLGLFQQTSAPFPTILVVLGIIVGLVNIAEKETTAFLVAAIALLLAGFTGTTGLATLPLADILTAILSNIVLFVAPAVVIVALKTVITIGKKK